MIGRQTWDRSNLEVRRRRGMTALAASFVESERKLEHKDVGHPHFFPWGEQLAAAAALIGIVSAIGDSPLDRRFQSIR